VVKPLDDIAAGIEAARGIGYPVLLKASAGGGGKGMRVVERDSDLPRSFEAAQREAQAAFGDGSLYLERYLDRPRHIEIQVLGDTQGTVVHLGERECSIQRRHQKLVEEAPSPALTPELREAMGQAAVRAARSVSYVGAGTIEFLYQDGDFYFLEMNTRIQVEHPVTELTTGLDLVAWQLRVASGEALDFTQQDVRWNGHAIECRITSEDASRGFMPSTGVVTHLEIPAGPGVRWDGGIRQGFEVSLHYDPPFHRAVMREPDFMVGNLSIRYVEEHPELLSSAEAEHDSRALALAAALLEDDDRKRRSAPRPKHAAPSGMSAWRLSAWPWQGR
jgi:acetyl-CoA carboxylase biotin carboxylase subunit